MNSVEKAYQVLEYIADAEDQEIRESLPVPAPPSVVRAVAAAASGYIPEQADDLDAFLTQLSEFCLSLRSDEPAAV